MKIIGCEIFRREVEAVAPDIAERTTWLAAGLHVDLPRLEEAIKTALGEAEGAVCLYGMCFPGIDDLMKECRACRLPGKDCVAAFLADDERKKLEGRRAFLMTPGWLKHWRQIFQSALSWDPIDARQNFGFYDVIILLDFGLEPIGDMDVLEFFEFIQVPIEVLPANLEHFRRVLRETVDRACGKDRL